VEKAKSSIHPRHLQKIVKSLWKNCPNLFQKHKKKKSGTQEHKEIINIIIIIIIIKVINYALDLTYIASGFGLQAY